MADSDGSKPPDRGSQSTSGKVDTKLKKAERTQQSPNAPSPGPVTGRSTADGPSGQGKDKPSKSTESARSLPKVPGKNTLPQKQESKPPDTESHSTSGEVDTKPKEAETIQQTPIAPSPTVTRSTTDGPSGQGKDEHSKSAESAAGSLQNVPGKKNKNEVIKVKRSTGQKQETYVQGMTEIYEQKHSVEQKNGEHNKEKSTGESTKTEIKPVISKANLDTGTVADKKDNNTKKLELLPGGKQDLDGKLTSDEKLAKQKKDQQVTARADDVQQIQIPHPGMRRKATKEDEDHASIAENMDGSYVLFSHVQSANGNRTEIDKDRGMSDKPAGDSNISKNLPKEKTAGLDEEEKIKEEIVEENPVRGKLPTAFQSDFKTKHQDHGQVTTASAHKLGENNKHEDYEKQTGDLDHDREHKKEIVQTTDNASVSQKTEEDKEGTCTQHDDSIEIPINVKTKSGKEVTITIKQTDTFAKVHEKIKDEEGFAGDVQRLVFDGTVLDVNQTLSDYNIGQGSTIHLVVGMTGQANRSIDSETSAKQAEAASEDASTNKVELRDGSMKKDDDDPKRFKNNLSEEEQRGEESKQSADYTKGGSGSALLGPSSIENSVEGNQEGAYQDHGEGETSRDIEEKKVKPKKIRATTPNVEELINTQQNASIPTDHTHKNSEGGDKQDLDVEGLTKRLKGMKLEEHTSEQPRQQERRQSDTVLVKKPPVPAPRKNHEGIPSAPKNLDVCYITSGSCKLCWEKPENDGGSNINEYIVKMREVDTEEWTTSKCVETECIITNLKESTQYMFGVAARNNIGTGKLIAQIRIETKWSYKNEGRMTVKSGEPMLLEMKFKGHASQKPHVSCLFNGDEHPDINRTSIQIEDSRIIFKLYNVVPCDKGKYTLTAENNTGRGVVVALLKVIDKPSPPKNLNISDITTESCHLHWEKPDHENGSSITKYIVQMCVSDGKDWKDTGSSSTTDVVVTGLQKGTEHFFRVAAENEAGTGAFAQVTYPITTEDSSENRQGSHTSESSSCGPASEDEITEDNFDTQHPSIEPPVDSLVTEILVQNQGNCKVGVLNTEQDTFKRPHEKVNPDQYKQQVTSDKNTLRSLDIQVPSMSKNEVDSKKKMYEIEQIEGKYFLHDGEDTKLLDEFDNMANVTVKRNIIFADGDFYKIEKDEEGKTVLREVENVPRIPKTKGKAHGTERTAEKLETKRQPPLPDAFTCIAEGAEQDNSDKTQIAAEFVLKRDIVTKTSEDLDGRKHLDVPDKPSPPNNLTISDITTESCHLHWQKPDHENGSSITKYTVQMCVNGEKDWKDTGSNTTTDTVVSGLQKGTAYLFRVAAENEVGTGAFGRVSEPITTNDNSGDSGQRNYRKQSYLLKLNVVYLLKSKEESDPIERPCDIETFMKWHFTLTNKKIFTRVSKNVKDAFTYELNCDDGILIVHLGTLSARPNVNSIMQHMHSCILDGTDNLLFSEMPAAGVSGSALVEMMMASNIGRPGDIYACYDNSKNAVYVVHEKSIRHSVDKELCTAMSVLTSEKCPSCSREIENIPLIFDRIFLKTNVEERVAEQFPDVNLSWICKPDEDKLVLRLTGREDTIIMLEKWLKKEYIDNYSCCSESYKKSVFPNTCIDPTKLILCLLRLMFTSHSDIVFTLNSKKESILISTDVTGGKAATISTKVKKSLKKCQNIVDCCIKISDNKDLERKINEYMHQDEDISDFLKMSISAREVRMEGVESVVEAFKNFIGKDNYQEVQGKGDNDESCNLKSCEFTVEDQLKFLEDKQVLAWIETKFNVGIELTCSEASMPVVSVKGVQNDITVFKDSMEQISHDDVNVDIIDTSALEKFAEALHTMNITENVQISSKNLDPTSSSNSSVTSQCDRKDSHESTTQQKRWFYSGHLIICTKKEVHVCDHSLLVRPHSRTNETEVSTVIYGNYHTIDLPIPEKGSDRYKHFISSELETFLSSNNIEDYRQIAIVVRQLETYTKHEYIKVVLHLFQNLLQDNSLPPTELILFCDDDTAYSNCTDICSGAIPSDIKVLLEKKELSKTSACAVVNIINTKMDLKGGMVSDALSNTSELQKELKRKKPNGMAVGEIVSTASSLPFCKHIIHGALDYFKDLTNPEKTMRHFVKSCLEEANSLDCESVAFPAAGACYFGFPKSIIAEVIFCALKIFQEDAGLPKRLKTVKLVLFHEDGECYSIFQKQKEIWHEYLKNRHMATLLGRQTVRLELASCLIPRQDSLIFLFDKKDLNKEGFTDNVLLNAAGKSVQEEVIKTREDFATGKKSLLPTHGGKIPVKILVHTPCDNSLERIFDGMVDALMMVNLQQGVKSTCIAFGSTHPFLQHGTSLVQTFIEAVMYASSSLDNLRSVVLMIDEPMSSYQSKYEYFKDACSTDIEAHKAYLHIVGFKEDVKTAKRNLLRQFARKPCYKIQAVKFELGKGVSTAPSEQVIDRGSATTNQGQSSTISKWNSESLQSWQALDKYVEMVNIPPDYTLDRVKAELFRPDFPVKQPKVIFLEQSKKALLICRTIEDAETLTRFEELKPFKFHCIQKKVLSVFEVQIDASFIKEISQKEAFLKKLTDLEIQVEKGPCYILKAPTTYQLQYARTLMTTSTDADIEIVEKITDVKESIWDVLRRRYDSKMKEFYSKLKSVSFDKDTVLVTMNKCALSDGSYDRFKDYIEVMKKKEFLEKEIHREYTSKAKAWCEEIEDQLKYECCTFVAQSKKVVALCNTYEDLVKVKHLLGLKTGEIKPTAREGRHRAKKDQESDKTGSTSTPRFDGVSTTSGDLKRKISSDEKPYAEFLTQEKVKIFVYEADILHLQVDCIVNAANKNLQHGGGVARVIARAAGHELTREGNELIAQMGSIPVGCSFSTTAGNLSYRYVIHTVGPAWYDYKPHTLKEVKRCEMDLYNAIASSILEAEKKECKSVAIPAVSSAIFGVPEELCVHQYVLATLSYSKKAVGSKDAVSEIHFVDKNRSIVQQIQKEFRAHLHDDTKCSYDRTSFVSYQGGAYNKVESFKTKSRESPRNGNRDTTKKELPEPLAFEDDEKHHFYYFLGDKPDILSICTRDILEERASAIVVTIDKSGKGGKVVDLLLDNMKNSSDKTLYKKTLSHKMPSKPELGSVFITKGLTCGYELVFNVVYPYDERNKKKNIRLSGLMKSYSNVLKLADQDSKIKSVVTTLFGIDSTKEDEIKMCAEAVLNSYIMYCKEKYQTGRSSPLSVKIVCQNEQTTDAACSVFNSYVLPFKDIDQSKNTQSDTTAVEAGSQNMSGAGENQDEENGECVICIDKITNPKTLDCGHKFCTGCIDQQFQFKQVCPTCGKVCGIITGNQPQGTMRFYIDKHRDCAGYEGCGYISIHYSFPHGKQGANHPHPGRYYSGIQRIGYIPYNEEGLKIAKMLKVAFDRKLVFTVGLSRTTGQEAITWNDIHHKTNIIPYKQFGYPDSTYLQRVREELAVKGITEEDIQDVYI